MEETHEIPVVEDANRRRGDPGDFSHLLVVTGVAVDTSGCRCAIWPSGIDDDSSALRPERANSNLIDDPSTGPGISYYLSLGDSVGMWDGTRSFPYLLANRYSLSSVPGLRLIDMSCSGETTESMVKGSTCAPGGSQYDNAVSFVNAHRGHIALVTISIGGNDVVPCMSRPGAATCFVNGLSKMKTNISTIVAGLRMATGPHVPIVGMNVYDPLLGDWLAPGPGRSLAVAAVAGVGLLSKTMGEAYHAEASPTADVQGAYHSADLTHFVGSSWVVYRCR